MEFSILDPERVYEDYKTYCQVPKKLIKKKSALWENWLSIISVICQVF